MLVESAAAQTRRFIYKRGTIKMQTTTKETDILIVGFGFSAIPLVRELDLSGAQYTVISEKDGSVWAGLDRAGALDFDLVSSYYTSFYTFDVVEDFSKDRYPTAREFYNMHLRYYRKYEDRIINDFVTHIENKSDHSLVHTRSGDTYRAKKVIISTAFKRKVHESLNNFDFTITDKTVVLNTIGDSANLIVAKLVTGDNRIICLQNGFVALDKLFTIGKTKYSLDQMEAHQLASYFKRLYRQIIDANFVRLVKIFPKNRLLRAYMNLVNWVQVTLGKVFTPHNFHVPFDSTRRCYTADRRPTAAFPNGVIAIKYWPIDTYANEFSDTLAESIEQGYLLNDLPFFAQEGLVELWSKDQTKVDQANKTIECNGQVVQYDHFIEGDSEVPRFPRITYERNGETVEYDYFYRNCYLGVFPKELNDIYLVGYTRPLSGGLANITEMQCLLVHKLLSDESFTANIRRNLDEKIEKYNRKYYPSEAPTPTDHLVFFGFYTEDVAKEMGIDLKLSSCRSLRDLGKYFNYPNNSDKYRQTGPYKVEGAAEFVDHVYDQHKGFKLLPQIITSYALYQVLFVGVAASLFFHGWINGYALGAALVFQWICGYWVTIPLFNTCPYYGPKLVLQLLYLPMLLNPWTALLVFPLDFLITYVMRKLPRARYVFNDLKNKKKYRSFFQTYKQVYNQVRRRAVAEVSSIAS